MARNASEQSLEPDLGIPQEDPNVTIDLDAEPEEDERVTEGDRSDDEPRGERTRDPKTGKWSQKKRERGEDRKGAQQWRQEKSTYEQRLKTMQEEGQRQQREWQQRFDNLMVQQRQQPAAQQQTQNPFAQQMTDLDAQLDAELRLIEADPKRDYKRYNELRRQETRLVAKEETWRANQGQKPQQQAPAASPYAARVPFIESEFPWTMDPANAELNKKAVAYRTYLIQAEGRLDTIDTDREALNWAANKFGAAFGIRPAPAAPSQRTQQMYGGPGQRTAPQRGQGGSREISIPKSMLNGSGLSAASIAEALRED